MIIYSDNIDNISPDMLNGFFDGWKNAPSPLKLFEILKNCEYFVTATDDKSKKVVGFIYAISDKILSAYIPLLEVIPEYQHMGIGSQLVKLMMKKLEDYYMVDIVCDENMESFYNNFGFKKYTAMMKRNYDNQKGK